MPSYLYRCPNCGTEHSITARMEEARIPPRCSCTCPTQPMQRIYGHMVGITYGAAGRQVFHDGYEGHGETTRETGELWVKRARAAGLDPEPVGTRWV